MFNEKDHLKQHIKSIRNLLKKFVNEHKKCKFVMMHKKVYSWVQYPSISGVNFQTLTFSEVMYSYLPLLLGWLIIPITKILNIYSRNENYINPNSLVSLSIAEAVQIATTNITRTDVITTIIIIPVIFFTVCYIKWRQKQNVIRF